MLFLFEIFRFFYSDAEYQIFKIKSVDNTRMFGLDRFYINLRIKF